MEELDIGAFKIADAAAYLSVSQDTIRRLVKSGQLAHARIGCSIRIPKASLEEYLESCVTTKWKPESGRGRKK